LLCGGAGLRLKGVTGENPKVMACVAGRPFLEFLLRQLRRHGFRRAILAVGYRQEAIRAHFGERACDIALQYSGECSPLGTGGALRKAANLIEAINILAMNGDSYTDVDLTRLLLMHAEQKADVSIVVVPADERNDCGLVLVDPNGRISRFKEKEKERAPGISYSNAGIYVCSRRMLDTIPEGVEVSLEEEMFQRWIQDNVLIRAFIHSGTCVDIGTPDRFQIAQETLANVEWDAAVPL
jgi:NDP-sugar pyrophosphorylase family protein